MSERLIRSEITEDRCDSIVLLMTPINDDIHDIWVIFEGPATAADKNPLYSIRVNLSQDYPVRRATIILFAVNDFVSRPVFSTRIGPIPQRCPSSKHRRT